jgi:hypothetical protein
MYIQLYDGIDGLDGIDGIRAIDGADNSPRCYRMGMQDPTAFFTMSDLTAAENMAPAPAPVQRSTRRSLV